MLKFVLNLREANSPLWICYFADVDRMANVNVNDEPDRIERELYSDALTIVASIGNGEYSQTSTAAQYCNVNQLTT